MTNKIEVIPAILESDLIKIQEKVKLVEPYIKMIHLDIMDGQFVPNKTFNQPEQLSKLKTSCRLEAHLMIKEPIKQIDSWLKTKVKKIIFHYEAVSNKSVIPTLINQIKASGKQVGIAINPATPTESLIPYLNTVNLVLFMAVNPGFAGQQFDQSVLTKISKLRKEFPELPIEVDGGINLETSKQAVEAGATIFIANSYIFKNQNIKEAIERLQNLAS